MIPYIYVPDLKLGPLTLHPFGLLVATGVLIGTSLAGARARRLGYDVDVFNSFVTWMLLAGFIGGHVLDEIFYHPEEILKRPWSLLMIWESLSSFGGFIGAVIGGAMWTRFTLSEVVKVGPARLPWFRRRKAPMPFLPYADLVLAVFPVAWCFGRLGCTVVHDHPGARAPVGSLLAVAYPLGPWDGTRLHAGPIQLIYGSAPRYDLGFLELLFSMVLALALALTWRRKLPMGAYVAIGSLAYAPVRFIMDFLRAPEAESGDLRWGILTFAQYCCIALFVFGLYMVRRARQITRSGEDVAAPLRARKSEDPIAVGQA